jgi:hypothetical protein
MSQDAILVATVADAPVVNAVLEAMGQGPDSLQTKAYDQPNQPWGAAGHTHVYTSFQGMPEDLFLHVLAWKNRDAPPLADGYAWGEGDLPDVETALDSLAQLKIGAYSNVPPGGQVAAMLTSLTLYPANPPTEG